MITKSEKHSADILIFTLLYAILTSESDSYSILIRFGRLIDRVGR